VKRRKASHVVRQELARFVEVRYADLLRTAYLLTGSPDAAEDLVQACLLRAMPRWEQIADPMAYLRRAMVNDRVSRWRRLRRELLRPDPPDVVVPDATTPVAERAVVLAALRRLPVRMRAVLVLRYWEDLSEAETAKLLGCSVGAVKSQASRGLDRLRSVLEPSTMATEMPTGTATEGDRR
jgi:RNA polymerase sigma-70 factor (sigma-E family)